ncbi:MAG: hypothetical protein C5B51_21265 [Terriglobia bacterium]|nr:MAG: hypothetical protein C5B51_21265 [Terriglobia bacterium]
MTKACAQAIAVAAIFLTCCEAATSSGPSVKPASLSFSYQVGDQSPPKAASVTVTLPASASASTIICAVPTYPAGTPASQLGWLTLPSAPQTCGHGPLSMNVLVNVTSLPPGSFTASISITTSPDVGTASVPVTLSISNPPSTLVITPGPAVTNFTPASGNTPDTLSFTYTTGSAWTNPQSELDAATNGTPIPFTVTAANAGSGSGSGGSSTPVWVRVGAPGAIPTTQTGGQASPGAAAQIIVSLDQTSVQTLLPGSYGGLVTFAAQNSANGSHTVAVNLVISAGPPDVTSIFPTSVIQAPVVNPVITINGQNFFSTSVATMAVAGTAAGGECTQTGTPIQMTSQLLSQTVLQATVNNAKALLASPGTWCVCVTNPAPPNAPGQPPACTPVAPVDYTFTVISSSTMAVTSVLNAASYQRSSKQIGTDPDPVASGQSSIAPGEIISIFGQNLGPAIPQPAIPAAMPAVVTSAAALAATLNTAALGSRLQFRVTGSGGSTNVTVDFSTDPNSPGGAESLDNIVSYINQVTTAAGVGGSIASVTAAAGSNYITLTSPTSGATAALTVTDNTAAQLLRLTSGANVTATGTAQAFPTQLSNIQVTLTYTDTTVSPPAVTTRNAPIIMVSNNQINAMAPFEIAAGIGGTASLSVLSAASSATVGSLLVVNENPGIFTLGSSPGTGQAAVLNYNTNTGAYTINSTKDTAARGSTIVIYSTGLGALVTPLADMTPAATADKVTDPVQVTIGGQPAVVTYAGTSPGSIGGLVQINAIVPPTVAAGQAVSLAIAGGTAATARQSQSGVTLAIK